MTILNLNAEELDRHTAVLSQKIQREHPAGFDLVLSIKNGGALVAQSFLKSYPRDSVKYYGEVELQRPVTKYKKGVLMKLLPHLPQRVLDLMRRFEASILNLKHRISRPKIRQIELASEISSRLKKGRPKVLVIDDAVDSGATARAVVDAIKRVNPQATVTMMVITVTTDAPLIMPEYFLYNNATLVRFPWSKDYKNHDCR